MVSWAYSNAIYGCMGSNCHSLLVLSLAKATAQITLEKFFYFWNLIKEKHFKNFLSHFF